MKIKKKFMTHGIAAAVGAMLGAVFKGLFMLALLVAIVGGGYFAYKKYIDVPDKADKSDTPAT